MLPQNQMCHIGLCSAPDTCLLEERRPCCPDTLLVDHTDLWEIRLNGGRAGFRTVLWTCRQPFPEHKWGT